LLTSAILPIVCVVSILRGWLAHVSGPRAMALRRLLTVPLIVGAVNALLFAIAAFTSDGF